MELIVRDKVFSQADDEAGPMYSGQFTEHIHGYVLHLKDGNWSPALIVENPFLKKIYLEHPATDGKTPRAALELAFDTAENH